MQIGDALINRIKELNASINIRPARGEDAAPFTELINSQYSRKKKEEYFHWQFVKSEIPNRLFVAYEKDTFVGCYGVQVHMLSNSVRTGFTIDLLIRKEYRNRALLVLFEERAIQFSLEQGAQIMTSLPNYDGMRAHTGLKTWSHIGTVKTYTVVVKAINEKRGMPDQRSFEQEFVFFSKSAAFRRWRYELNPEHEYEYVRLRTGEFAVTKVFRDPVTGVVYGDIVDFECSLYNLPVLRELLLGACNHLREKNVQMVTTWALPHTPLSIVAESIGFIETGPERYFCFKALKPVADRAYDFPRWHLVQADSEIY